GSSKLAPSSPLTDTCGRELRAIQLTKLSALRFSSVIASRSRRELYAEKALERPHINPLNHLRRLVRLESIQQRRGVTLDDHHRAVHIAHEFLFDGAI